MATKKTPSPATQPPLQLVRKPATPQAKHAQQRENAQRAPTAPTPFAPTDFTVVTEHKAEMGLLLGGDADDLIRSFTATVYPADPAAEEESEQREKVANVHFDLVAFGAVGGDGANIKFNFADAVDGELVEIADALFDDKGDLRESLDMASFGPDVLHIREIDVASPHESSGHDTFQVIRHLLAHILERYGHGCMCAVYYQADSENIDIAPPLMDRGFRKLRGRHRRVWFIDLGRVPPPLDGGETTLQPPGPG